MDIDDGSRVSPNSIYNELSAKIKQDGPKLLLDKGDEYYGAGDYANAIVYYDFTFLCSCPIQEGYGLQAERRLTKCQYYIRRYNY